MFESFKMDNRVHETLGNENPMLLDTLYTVQGSRKLKKRAASTTWRQRLEVSAHGSVSIR